MCLSACFTYTVLRTWHRYPKNYLRIICLRKVPKRGTSGRIFFREFSEMLEVSITVLVLDTEYVEEVFCHWGDSE